MTVEDLLRRQLVALGIDARPIDETTASSKYERPTSLQPRVMFEVEIAGAQCLYSVWFVRPDDLERKAKIEMLEFELSAASQTRPTRGDVTVLGGVARMLSEIVAKAGETCPPQMREDMEAVLAKILNSEAARELMTILEQQGGVYA